MRNPPAVSTRLVNFLGSMNLAISLLVVLAIYRFISTALVNAYTDYQIKFGSFWFEMFKTLACMMFILRSGSC